MKTCFRGFRPGRTQTNLYSHRRKPRRFMSRVIRKPNFCICENKDADQLRGHREADQRLCFRYIDSTIPLLAKSEISSILPSSVPVQPSLFPTWSENPKVFSQRGSHFLMIWIFSKREVANICNPPWFD